MHETGFAESAHLRLLALDDDETEQASLDPVELPEEEPSYDALPPAAGFGLGV